MDERNLLLASSKLSREISVRIYMAYLYHEEKMTILFSVFTLLKLLKTYILQTEINFVLESSGSLGSTAVSNVRFQHLNLQR